MSMITIIRGGGDLASGVALRLHRAGLKLIVTELSQPLAVRRLVSFAEAVYAGTIEVEGVKAHCVEDVSEALEVVHAGQIAVMVDAHMQVLQNLHHTSGAPELGVLIDGRMIKRPPEFGLEAAPLVIGLGPGFNAGENCHAVVETNRGHNLGRVLWQGSAEADTGIPESVSSRRSERVLRAPRDGLLVAHAQIGDHLEQGQIAAEVAGEPILAPFKGVLRGLVHPGIAVKKNFKVGDLDPRDDPTYCTQVSDKALAVGGGVLEAILSRSELRHRLWS
ncbi:MAG: selenium-dependent molybdenum cofactor biosynthesis protein YqeB [Anaerolineales bacterium]|jgi:xanthine dehydrogenase accessory factor